MELAPESVDAQQAGQRQYDGLVAEPQRGTGLLDGDAAVGLLDNLAQQVALSEGLLAAVMGIAAEGEIPEGVPLLPVVEQFVVGIEIVKVDLGAQVGALHARCHLEQLAVQVVGVHAVVSVG